MVNLGISYYSFDRHTSRLKSTPPIGAPKATDMPAAAAAERTSRFLASLLLRFSNGRMIMLAQQHATWTSGPSLPSQRPDATERHFKVINIQLPK